MQTEDLSLSHEQTEDVLFKHETTQTEKEGIFIVFNVIYIIYLIVTCNYTT